MTSFLRRISLRRLTSTVAATVAAAIAGTAVALAVTAGPTPPPKPLASAIHAALSAPAPSGVTAQVQLVNNLFEGSEVAAQAGGGGAGGAGGSESSNPLLSGGSGRLWASEGRLRLELQSQHGAIELLYDEGTFTLYDPAGETVYRYTPPQQPSQGAKPQPQAEHGVPSVEAIEKELTQLAGHLVISGATPTDVAGQPAYSATVAPKRGGGLFGDAELAWDASNGAPLRFAIYAKGASAPAIELTVTEISFGPVPSSDFSLALPSGLKETKIEPGGPGAPNGHGAKPNVQTTGIQAVQAALPFSLQAPSTLAGMGRREVRLIAVNGHSAALVRYGEGLGGIAVIEAAAGGHGGAAPATGSGTLALPTRTINGAKATVLPTELGTALSFQSGGVQHILLGSVTASTIEAAARGL
ncbi:MAG: hypothetical protein ACYCUM_00250 [Solirubrobacteraceae bacterium]